MRARPYTPGIGKWPTLYYPSYPNEKVGKFSKAIKLSTCQFCDSKISMRIIQIKNKMHENYSSRGFFFFNDPNSRQTLTSIMMIGNFNSFFRAKLKKKNLVFIITNCKLITSFFFFFFNCFSNEKWHLKNLHSNCIY